MFVFVALCVGGHLAVMRYRFEKVALVQVNIIYKIFNGLTTIFKPKHFILIGFEGSSNLCWYGTIRHLIQCFRDLNKL